MRHFASPAFWQAYAKLPDPVRALADKNYALLKENPQHPSLSSRKSDASGRCASAFAPRSRRGKDGDLVWFWIGSHADYDSLIN